MYMHSCSLIKKKEKNKSLVAMCEPIMRACTPLDIRHTHKIVRVIGGAVGSRFQWQLLATKSVAIGS